MSQLQSGETYADGQTVNAARLNNTVNLATALPGLITDQGSVTPVPADQVLLHQASSGQLKRSTLSAVALAGATFQGTPVTLAGTSLSTGVMMGLPGTITPSFSGRIFVSCSGAWTNDTAGAGGNGGLFYGTGTKPVNGAAPAGTQCSGNVIYNGYGANVVASFSVSGIFTGVVGTTYWLDFGMSTNAVGTILLVANACIISAFEF
jgi:hypothetical protein